MFNQIDEIKNLAFKYSKQELGRMAQMGMIDPQKAMMAGMMRDRVSKEDTKPPTTTVAQDVLGTAPQMQQPAQPQQMGMAPQAQPQAPTQMAASGGVTSLPVQEHDYAGGGIVAFADGGDTDDGVAHFDQGGFNFPQNSLMGMYQKWRTDQPTSGANAVMALEELDARIAATPPGPERDKMIANREYYGTAARAAKANTQQFPMGIIATPEGQQAQQQQAPAANVGIDTITNPLNPAGEAPATAANKAPAGGVGMGGGPRLPAIKVPSGKIDVEKYTPKAPQELKDIRSEKEQYYKDLGIDPDVYNKMIEKEEGKRGEFGKRKEEAKGEFLMNLGLGLVGAKRGQEGQALSESGIKAAASYKDSMKDVRAAEEKLDDRINSFRLADQQAKKTGADQDIAKRDHQKELVEAAESKYVDAKNSAKAKEAEVGANIYHSQLAADTQLRTTAMSVGAQREYTAALKQRGLEDAQINHIMTTATKLKEANPRLTDEEAMKQAMGMFRSAVSGLGLNRNTPAAGGLRRDANGSLSYVPAT